MQYNQTNYNMDFSKAQIQDHSPDSNNPISEIESQTQNLNSDDLEYRMNGASHIWMISLCILRPPRTYFRLNTSVQKIKRFKFGNSVRQL